MTGLISKTKNIHNLTLEDQCLKMLTQIVLSQAMFTMTGLISKTVNTHNQISEDQCHKMLTQTALSPAMSTTTGLISKTVNIHNQISEDQCHKMLIQTALSQATFTMTGLTFNKKIQNPQIQMTHNQMKKMFNYKVLIWSQFGSTTTSEKSQKDSLRKEMIDLWTH